MKCHYDILNLSRDADDSEIKTAYRKLALKWHPDKNIDNPTLAKEQFQLVQQAYEVLSDRQERAWYDKYREQILRGGSEGKFQDDSLDVFQYFTSSCFKGYNDNEDGFYTVYRTVFDKLSAEDIEYHETESDAENIPNFGNSTSDYDTVVGPFYAYWMAYSTKKSYVWLDTHDIRETRDRKVIKMMEKENKKIRIKAKKERNEEVRSLVSYVRKRDKRVQAYNKMLEAKALENRIKQEELRKQRLIERNKELDEAKKKQQEWSKFENMKSELKEIEKSLAEQFGEAISDSDIESDCEDLIENNLYCAACNKVFKTPKAFGNHESSKKHKSNVEKLRAEMLGEDDIEEEEVKEQSDLETTEVVLDKNNSDEEKSAKKSKKNKNKKKQNICNDVSDEETSLLNTSKLEKRSKKQKQNKTKSESDSDIPKDPDNLEKNVISEEEDIETFLLNGLSKKQKKKLNSKSLELSKVREEKVKQVNDSDSEENQCNGDTNNITKDSESKNIKAKKNRTKVDNIPSTEMHLFRQLLSRIASKMSRKLTYPAAERNKQPILNILKQYLTEGKTLEIASGSGQHVAYFAQHLPYITFQPSEYEECLLESISAHITESQVNNVNKPILIDVTQDCATWKLTDRFNYIYNANMMHISPYKCTENLFINAGKLLDKGLLITYGPYAKNGVIEPQSNIDFDRSLRYQNPQWGLRDINDLEELAKKNGLLLLNIHDMPSNNKILIWKKI